MAWNNVASDCEVVSCCLDVVKCDVCSDIVCAVVDVRRVICFPDAFEEVGLKCVVMYATTVVGDGVT